MIFFTADTHYSHKNILKYQPHSRPFADVHEMNKALTERWNSVVHKDDTIYHLGDFAFCGTKTAQEIFGGLNGHKILITGNHDNKGIRELGWELVSPLMEISICANGQPYRITLCHFAMKVWNKSHHGALQLYGHSHGSMAGTSQSADVGVDCWDCYPVTLEQILQQMAESVPYSTGDHHGKDTD